ncbi:MAG: TetR/AcrR family transcriptional regulator [Deltaproteobacteria bacterium]|nr:TetR/AcrR family transcriptional regulator [Deltaproteobacteria bacterium]
MPPRETAAPKDKHETILAAAKQLFGQYGYRRTSIDDIAQEAHIAKGTVYLYFKSKEEIFRALCQQLLDTVLAATEEACRTSTPVEQQLRRIVAAKFDYLFALVYDSAHVRELIDAKNQLSADIFSQADRRYLRLLGNVIANAVARGELNLARVGMEPEAVAELLVRSAAGNELYGSTLPTPAAMRKRLDALVRVFVAALDGTIVH